MKGILSLDYNLSVQGIWWVWGGEETPYFSSLKRQRAPFWFHFPRIQGQEFWDPAGMEELANLGSKGRSKCRTPVVHFLFFSPKPKQDVSNPKTKLPSHIPVQNSPSFTILEVSHYIFWTFSFPFNSIKADLGWGSQPQYLSIVIRIWTSTFFLKMKYFLISSILEDFFPLSFHNCFLQYLGYHIFSMLFSLMLGGSSQILSNPSLLTYIKEEWKIYWKMSGCQPHQKTIR